MRKSKLCSPKKEKKDPLAAAPVVAGAPVVASEAPVLAPIAVEEVKVEEAKAGLVRCVNLHRRDEF